MPTPKDHIGVKGDECVCGRRKSVLHCPHCGSSRVYARKRRLHKMLNGEEKFVEIQFCCQRCGHFFIEEEREWCDAPPVGPVLAQQKAIALFEAHKAGEHLRPSDERAAKAMQEYVQTQSLVEARAKTPADIEQATKDLEYALRYQWADINLEAKMKGEVPTEDVETFVSRNMKERGIEYTPEMSYYGNQSTRRRYSDTQEPSVASEAPTVQQVVDNNSDSSSNDAKHRELQLTWSRLKLEGKTKLSFEEYCRVMKAQ
jgi:hypothetical protein